MTPAQDGTDAPTIQPTDNPTTATSTGSDSGSTHIFNSTIFGEYADIIILAIFGFTLCCIVIGCLILCRMRQIRNQNIMKIHTSSKTSVEMHHTTIISTGTNTIAKHIFPIQSTTDSEQLTKPPKVPGIMRQNSLSQDASPTSPSSKSLPDSPINGTVQNPYPYPYPYPQPQQMDINQNVNNDGNKMMNINDDSPPDPPKFSYNGMNNKMPIKVNKINRNPNNAMNVGMNNMDMDYGNGMYVHNQFRAQVQVLRGPPPPPPPPPLQNISLPGATPGVTLDDEDY